MRISNAIVKPLITEKTMSQTDEGRYAFKVTMEATKGKIAQSINELFGVNVTQVKTMIMPGKPKRVGRTNRIIKTSKWKKAVVKLKEGQKIALFDRK
jgi:large subunit ribosomal protein L23